METEKTIKQEIGSYVYFFDHNKDLNLLIPNWTFKDSWIRSILSELINSIPVMYYDDRILIDITNKAIPYFWKL